mgnify:CR=1 FL=1
MEDDASPRPRGDAASQLAGEDLAPYSQSELAARIALLEAEIARVEKHRQAAAGAEKAGFRTHITPAYSFG